MFGLPFCLSTEESQRRGILPLGSMFLKHITFESLTGLKFEKGEVWSDNPLKLYFNANLTLFSWRPLEGPLIKFTNVMKGWQQRWFLLDPESGMLEYFEVSILTANIIRRSITIIFEYLTSNKLRVMLNAIWWLYLCITVLIFVYMHIPVVNE